MALPDYSYLYDHACERKGGEKALKALLPKTKSKAQLKKLGSDRYLAEFTRKIFQSTLFPYTTLFRSESEERRVGKECKIGRAHV